MLKIESDAAGNDWMLPPVCARPPAALFCKADSASLCAACDAEIHSSNPLAVGEVDETASWLLLNPVKNNDNSLSYGNDDPASFCGVVDEYLNLGDYNGAVVDHQFNINEYNNFSNNNHKDDDDVARSAGDDSSNVGYSYSASMSHAVSFSTLDVGVVSEESTTMSENSPISHTRPPRGAMELLAGPLAQMHTQLSVMDREARVLRYREKKKARKFEKTIRYASRKAYAETRPRIKGRFARRTSVAEFEVADQLFSASLLAEAAGFGIVPSFEA